MWLRSTPANNRSHTQLHVSPIDLGTDDSRFTDADKIKKTVALGHQDTLRVSLTTKEGSRAKKPHQAFLILKETKSGLEAPFPLTVKESGKATVQIVRDTPDICIITDI